MEYTWRDSRGWVLVCEIRVGLWRGWILEGTGGGFRCNFRPPSGTLSVTLPYALPPTEDERGRHVPRREEDGEGREGKKGW